MKLLMLAAGSSIHTARWVNGLTRAGLSVTLATQHELTHPLDDAVDVIELPNCGNAGYFLMASKLRRLADKLQPDLLNAHFASGYGTTARLMGRHPYVLSVWGSDVFSFPERSALHRWLVVRNLKAADIIASTSRVMADRVRALVPAVGDIPITSFGIDLGLFSDVPELAANNARAITIGTVKAMEDIYGVDTLIEAFAQLRSDLSAAGSPLSERLALRLVGGGSRRAALEQQAQQLGVGDAVTVVGQGPHSAVPAEIGKLDVFVALSRQESFGVAVLEAGAAGRPVVVSDADGLVEVVQHGQTGLIVPREDPGQAAEALRELVESPERRLALGSAGRAQVSAAYSWDQSVSKMLEVYDAALGARRPARRES